MSKLLRLLIAPALTGLALLGPAAFTPKEAPAALSAEIQFVYPSVEQASAVFRNFQNAGYFAYLQPLPNGWYSVHVVFPDR
jgi:hypothetical protein